MAGPPSETVTKRTKRLIVGEFGWTILDDGRPSNKFSRATASRCGLSAPSVGLSVPPTTSIDQADSRHKKVPYLSVGISITMVLHGTTQSITTGGSDECGSPQGGS